MQDFSNLDPDTLFDAVEAAGFNPTGECTQLNSYENRVFDLRIEPSQHQPLQRVIAKFYRPGRWSPQAISDEHQFLAELAQEGIPAVCPLTLNNGESSLQYGHFILSLFPKILGRMPQEFLPGELRQVGRTLARIHNVGARRPALHRPRLDAESFGWRCFPMLEKFVYPDLAVDYFAACETILICLEEMLDTSRFLRIHGDCHKGNLLQREGEFFFVDFDDFVNGPEVQDFWMLLSSPFHQGDDSESVALKEQEEICLGYEELRSLPDDWALFEPLRGLRIISYSHWIAMRWNDPAFKQLFPQFLTYNHWLEETSTLQKLAASL